MSVDASDRGGSGRDGEALGGMGGEGRCELSNVAWGDPDSEVTTVAKRIYYGDRGHRCLNEFKDTGEAND